MGAMASSAALPPEIQLAQRLAGNEQASRDRAVRRLRKFIVARTEPAAGGSGRSGPARGLHVARPALAARGSGLRARGGAALSATARTPILPACRPASGLAEFALGARPGPTLGPRSWQAGGGAPGVLGFEPPCKANARPPRLSHPAPESATERPREVGLCVWLRSVSPRSRSRGG